METARQLLSDRRLNVREVAQAVGYANQSRFAAAFRKQFGINPKAFSVTSITNQGVD
jgi:AraC family transcriptional regulator, transcriptional activator of the genes for pyochelin and ferripyochelin receptors